MTENEAIEILRNNYPKTCKMVNGRYEGGFDDTECEFGKALLLSISALEEIQQYRAIGTVAECQAAMGRCSAVGPIMRNMAAYCPYCDTRLNAWYNFCPDCGQAIDRSGT